MPETTTNYTPHLSFSRRGLFAFLMGLLLLWWLFALPDPLFDQPASVVIEDRHGQLLGARIAADGQWRFPPSDSLQEVFVSSLLRFEDRRFQQHWGVDLRALARAVRQNVQAGRVVSGGSTISMQVIRMARGNPPRTFWQKGIELLMALRLELTFSKTEILQLWSANAPFGGNVVGLEAASWRYFGKGPSLLSWAEAATLAILPNSPGLIHPGRNRTALREKRNRLLHSLLEGQSIDSITYQLALAEPLPERPLALPRLAPALLERIAKEKGPGRWRLSIEAHLQRQVKELASKYQQKLAHNGIHNLAVLVVDNRSGATLAYLGNLEHLAAEHSPAVDLIQAPRSPGSLLKPLLYGLAVEEGLLMPRQLLPDIPSVFGDFRPENFHRAYQGAVSADMALARSLNIPFVHLLQQYGVAPFHQALRNWGFQQLHQPPEHYGLSLILGGAEVSLWEITGWYTGLARMLLQANSWQGQYHRFNWRPPYLSSPADSSADSLQSAPIHLGYGAAWATVEAIEHLQRPDSEGDWESFSSSQRMAWKTGTSFGFRDAWSVGLDPNYTIGVWVGNADGEGRPGLVGIQAAAPLLFSVRRLLPASERWFKPPRVDLQSVQCCRQSGLIASRHCPDKKREEVPLEIPRAVACSLHEAIFLDSASSQRVHQGCISSGESLEPTSWFSLPPLQAHYYRSNHPDYAPLPAWRPGCEPSVMTDQPMQWIYPRQAERISIPRNWDGTRSAVIFTLAHQQLQSTVHWHLNGQYLGATFESHVYELQPPPGRHVLMVVDEKGNQLERAFEITD